jgi:chromosome segregation ATPase
MEYLQLKEQLTKILNDDVQNRQSLQEFRRNVFLNTESTKKHEQLISEKEHELNQLNNSIQRIEQDAQKKNTLVEELQFQLEIQKEEFEKRENGLLDLINTLKNEIETYKNSNTELSADQQHMSNLSVQNAEYAGKIRELIYHIDTQNEKEIELNSKVKELESELKTSTAEIETLQAKVTSMEHDSTTKQKLVADMEELTLKNSDIENELSFTKHLVAELKQNIKNYESTQLQLISENNELQETFRAEHELMQKDNSELIAELSLVQFEIENVKAENSELKKNIIKLNEVSDESELKSSIISELEEKLLVLEETNNKNQELNNELIEFKDKLQYHELLSDEFDSLNEKHTLVTNEINQLISNLSQKSAEHEQLISDHMLLNEKFNSLQNEFDELNEEHVGISEIRNELFSLNELLVEKNTTIHELENELEKIQQQLSINLSSNNNSDSLQLRVNELIEDTEKLHQQISDLNDNSKKLSDEYEFEKSNLNLIITDLKSQLSQSKSAINNLNEDAFIDKLFKQIDLLNDENAVLATENDDIKNALTEIHKKYESLSQVIENQKSEIINLEERNKQIKLATEFEVLDEDSSDLKLKINELVREIDKCIALLSE